MEAKQKTDSYPETISQGVESLIDRLRENGVNEGREQARQITGDAQQQARKLIEDAEAKAKEIVETAHKAAEAERSAARDACEIAARDTVLSLRGQLGGRLKKDVARLVEHELKNPEILKQIILIIAGRSAEKVKALDEEQAVILLPRDVIGLSDLRENPSKLRDDALTDMVLGLSKDMLKDGICFKANEASENGIRIRFVDKEIELDLTDTAIAEILLEHIQPRFRALLEGIVK